jgi:hypothetical protein
LGFLSAHKHEQGFNFSSDPKSPIRISDHFDSTSEVPAAGTETPLSAPFEPKAPLAPGSRPKGAAKAELAELRPSITVA